MKSYNLLYISFLFMSSLTEVNAQVLSHLTVREELKPRMEKAIEMAKSYSLPSWCDTQELQKKREIIIEKSIKTLFYNHLAPINRIRYEGVMPSVTTFKGLWSWDSWKHAVGLSYVDEELAKNSIRGLYDYQDENGMIPDCVFPDSLNFTGSTCVTELTKPPLSGWAIWEVYKQTGDKSFVREMFSRLIKYHEWRYEFRDINKNGICELGANVNKVNQAMCEMADNAIRYDNVKLLKKSDDCYSMDAESVDLNSYLYQEKNYIVKMAELLGEKDIARKYKKDMKVLKKRIQEIFFDSKTGFFYDVRISDGSFILSQESCGWTPLFTGVASKRQAAQVVKTMMDDDRFNTLVPLPTASKECPEFDPEKGYWRGPVWIDQFYFGYVGLMKYGYKKEADYLLKKMLKNAEGISDPQFELREYYNPLTGKAGGARNFGWTSSHLLLLMLENIK